MQITPEVETQFAVGDSNIYIVEVEEDADQYNGYGHGRTRITGHDDDGNEVEVFIYTVSRETFLEEMGYDPKEL